MLRRLVYVSAATRAIPREELELMLEGARRRNRAAGITGMLLYDRGSFMQAIEGHPTAPTAVEMLLKRIEADDRHTGMMILIDEQTGHREFTAWAMSFRDLGQEECEIDTGRSSFLSGDSVDSRFLEEPRRAWRLLLSFRATARDT